MRFLFYAERRTFERLMSFRYEARAYCPPGP